MSEEPRRETGLELYSPQLHPDVVEKIESWADDPELASLRAALEAHTDEINFFDAYAEALVAYHLLGRGCALRREVPTPSGRTCDFEVERDGRQVYVHVKRVRSEAVVPRQLTISPRLRYLERLKRPYIVQIRWHDGLTDEQMQHFVYEAAQFINRAKIGDELAIRDSGVELGGVRIAAPWSGSHVSLAIGLPSGFSDETVRIFKLLTKAYKQFMPGAMNVVLVCSMNEDDAIDFQSALLGTPIERWDTAPPRGRRVAHGRDADGFWHAQKFIESVFAAWYTFAPGDAALEFRCWQRQDFVVDHEMQWLLGSLFDRA